MMLLNQCNNGDKSILINECMLSFSVHIKSELLFETRSFIFKQHTFDMLISLYGLGCKIIALTLIRNGTRSISSDETNEWQSGMEPANYSYTFNTHTCCTLLRDSNLYVQNYAISWNFNEYSFNFISFAWFNYNIYHWRFKSSRFLITWLVFYCCLCVFETDRGPITHKHTQFLIVNSRICVRHLHLHSFYIINHSKHNSILSISSENDSVHRTRLRSSSNPNECSSQRLRQWYDWYILPFHCTCVNLSV